MKKSNAAIIALTGFAALAFALTQASTSLAAGPGASPPLGTVVPTFNGLDILPSAGPKLSIDPISGAILNNSGTLPVIFTDVQGIGLNSGGSLTFTGGGAITAVGNDVKLVDGGTGVTRVDAQVPITNSSTNPIKFSDSQGIAVADSGNTVSLTIDGITGAITAPDINKPVSIKDINGLFIGSGTVGLGLNIYSNGSLESQSGPVQIYDNEGFAVADLNNRTRFQVLGTTGAMSNPYETVAGVSDPLLISDKLDLTANDPSTGGTAFTGAKVTVNQTGNNNVVDANYGLRVDVNDPGTHSAVSVNYGGYVSSTASNDWRNKSLVGLRGIAGGGVRNTGAWGDVAVSTMGNYYEGVYGSVSGSLNPGPGNAEVKAMYALNATQYLGTSNFFNWGLQASNTEKVWNGSSFGADVLNYNSNNQTNTNATKTGLRIYNGSTVAANNYLANYGLLVQNLDQNTSRDASYKYGAYIASSGAYTGLGGLSTNNYGLYVAPVTGADNNYAAVFADGNVGMGTTAPSSGLHVVKDLPFAYAIDATNNGNVINAWTSATPAVAISGEASSGLSTGVFGRSDNGYAVKGLSQNATGYGGYFTNNTGTGLYVSSTSGYGAIFDKGNVGMGTTTPANKLEVRTTVATGEDNGSIASYAQTRSTSNAIVGYGLNGPTVLTRGSLSSMGQSSAGTINYGVWGHDYTTSGYGVFASNGADQSTATVYAGLAGGSYSGIFMGGNVGIGTTSPTTGRLSVAGGGQQDAIYASNTKSGILVWSSSADPLEFAAGFSNSHDASDGEAEVAARFGFYDRLNSKYQGDVAGSFENYGINLNIDSEAAFGTDIYAGRFWKKASSGAGPEVTLSSNQTIARYMRGVGLPVNDSDDHSVFANHRITSTEDNNYMASLWPDGGVEAMGRLNSESFLFNANGEKGKYEIDAASTHIDGKYYADDVIINDRLYITPTTQMNDVGQENFIHGGGSGVKFRDTNGIIIQNTAGTETAQITGAGAITGTSIGRFYNVNYPTFWSSPNVAGGTTAAPSAASWTVNCTAGDILVSCNAKSGTSASIYTRYVVTGTDSCTVYIGNFGTAGDSGARAMCFSPDG